MKKRLNNIVKLVCCVKDGRVVHIEQKKYKAM
jgi:hypothetical protein